MFPIELKRSFGNYSLIKSKSISMKLFEKDFQLLKDERKCAIMCIDYTCLPFLDTVVGKLTASWTGN